MNKEISLVILLLILLFLLGVGVGYITANVHNGTPILSTNITLAGYWSNGYVCINVEDLSFDKALMTCRHEIGHEMFASGCQESDLAFEECSKFIDENIERFK